MKNNQTSKLVKKINHTIKNIKESHTLKIFKKDTINLKTLSPLKSKVDKNLQIQIKKDLINLKAHYQNLYRNQEGQKKNQKISIIKKIDQVQVHHVLHLNQAVHLHHLQTEAHHHLQAIPVHHHILKV